jgi:hypothetical protein
MDDETAKRDRRMLTINDLADKQIAAIIFNHESRQEYAKGDTADKPKAEALFTLAQGFQSEVNTANATIDDLLGSNKGSKVLDPRRHHGYKQCIYAHVTDDMLFSYEVSDLKGKMELTREENLPEFAEYIGARWNIQHNYLEAFERLKERGETITTAAVSQYVKDADAAKLGTIPEDINIGSGLKDLLERNALTIPDRRAEIADWINRKPPEQAMAGKDDSFTPSSPSFFEQPEFAASPDVAGPVPQANRIANLSDSFAKSERMTGPKRPLFPKLARDTAKPAELPAEEEAPAQKGFFSRMKERLSHWKNKGKNAIGKTVFANYQTPEEKAANADARAETIIAQAAAAKALSGKFSTGKTMRRQTEDDTIRAESLPGTFSDDPFAPLPKATMDFHQAKLKSLDTQSVANAPDSVMADSTKQEFTIKPEGWGGKEDMRAKERDTVSNTPFSTL